MVVVVGGGGVGWEGLYMSAATTKHPPLWCWSQAAWVCPGEGWRAGWEGDSSSSSSRGEVLLSWPTGGGHGRSLITLISTASVAQWITSGGAGWREVVEEGEKRKEGKQWSEGGRW